MNLNDLKNRCQAVKAPAVPSAATRGSAQPLNGLIDKLKAQEAKEARQLRKARPLWLVAAAAFLLMFVVMLCLPSATVRPARLLLGGVLAAVYLLNAALMGRKLLQLARIDYTESLRSFLDKAEARHRFMGPQARWLAGSGLVVLGVVSGVYWMTHSSAAMWIPSIRHSELRSTAWVICWCARRVSRSPTGTGGATRHRCWPTSRK